MNNTFLSIILLLVLMFVVLTSLNKSAGSTMFGNTSTFLLVLVLILIIHFLLKNVLKTRGNKVPQEDLEKFSGKCKDEKVVSEVENFEMKNDLLEYVQNMGSSKNTMVEVNMKPEVELVSPNHTYDKLASYGSEAVTDLNSFFNVSSRESCVFTEVPTGSKTSTAPVKEPEAVDRVSRESLYLSSRNDNMVKAKTLNETTWQYDNERVMNGGELFNGISGYNDGDSGYASVL